MAKSKKAIEAGKARASSSLRDSKGRFTTNIFKREVLKTIAAKKGFNVSADEKQKDRDQVDKIIKEAKITNSELNKEYKQNLSFFSEMIERGGVQTTFKNSTQIEKAIRDYKGSFYIDRDGERIKATKTEMLHELKKYKQFLSTSVNASDFAKKLTLTFDGKMQISLPDLKKLRSELAEMKRDTGETDYELFEEGNFGDDDDTIVYRS